LLQSKRDKLAAEIDGKEKCRIKLNESGFSDLDLLRLRKIIGDAAKQGNYEAETFKEGFFTAIVQHGDLINLQKEINERAKECNERLHEKAMLDGEIAELNITKSKITGAINATGVAGTEQIKAAAAEEVTAIRQKGIAIREEFQGILSNVLSARKDTDVMKAEQKQAQVVANELQGTITTIQRLRAI